MNDSYTRAADTANMNTGASPTWIKGPEQPDLPISSWWNVAPTGSSPSDLQGQVRPTPVWSWGLYRDDVTVRQGQIMDISAFASRVAALLKLERQQSERLAAVSLDPCARDLMGALDEETSIKWEDVPDRVKCDWSEALRSAVILAGANLCEASPTRIRLSEYGAKLLAESAPPDQPTTEIAN